MFIIFLDSLLRLYHINNSMWYENELDKTSAFLRMLFACLRCYRCHVSSPGGTGEVVAGRGSSTGRHIPLLSESTQFNNHL